MCMCKMWTKSNSLCDQYIFILQSWYKGKKRSTSKVLSYPSAKRKLSNILCSWHVKQNFVSKCQIISPRDKSLFFICDDCFHKFTLHHNNKEVHLKLNKRSVDCCSFSNISLPGSVPGYKLLAFCKNPRRCNNLFLLDSGVNNKCFFHIILGQKTTDTHVCNTDKAVRILQKAWRR